MSRTSKRTPPRARAADAPPQGGPENEPEAEKPADPKDREAERTACAEKCRAAEASYTSAAAAMGAAAKELEGGGDSLTILMAAEDAARAADDASDDVMASLAGYRGAPAAPESSDPGGMEAAPGAPSAPMARSIVSAAPKATAASAIEVADMAALGREVMKRSGAKNMDAALLAVEAAFTARDEIGKLRAAEATRAKAEDLRGRMERLGAAVHGGMDRARAFVIDEKGNPEKPLPVWMRGSLSDLDETLATMGFAAGKPVTTSSLVIASPDDGGEAGLAARAAAAGVDIETRRAAEKNVAASAAKERGR